MVKLVLIVYKIYYHSSTLRNFPIHPPKTGVVYTPLKNIYDVHTKQRNAQQLFAYILRALVMRSSNGTPGYLSPVMYSLWPSEIIYV
jgi:hypothetical protein